MRRSHRFGREHRHTYWGNSLAPVLNIVPGDEVFFEILDASNGQLTPKSSGEEVHHLDFDNVNPVTGPVYVAGADPGDAFTSPLSMGDPYAAQGEGEVCCSGVESPIDGIATVAALRHAVFHYRSYFGRRL